MNSTIATRKGTKRKSKINIVFNKYKNGKIYKIINDVDDKIYIGSTCDTLCKRMANHRNMSNRCNTKIYSHFISIGIEHFKIILIEKYPCDNKNELLKREAHYIKELKSELNQVRPFITEEERKEAKIKYYNSNKAKLCEGMAKRRSNNKVEDAIKQKEWRESNKERVKRVKKEYYMNNQDKIKEKRGIKYTCTCGKNLTFAKKKRHESSVYHISRMNYQE